MYVGYSNPYSRPAADQDSMQGIISEHSQLMEVCDLLDLLYG